MPARFSRIALRRQARTQPQRRGVMAPVRRRWPGPILFVLSMVVLVAVVGSWLAWRRSDPVETSRNILFVSADLDAKEVPVVLVHLSPQDNTLELVRIAPEMSVSVLGGYGNYPLRSILPLFLLDHRSNEYIRAAYSSALQLPIQTVVMSTKGSTEIRQQKAASLFWEVLRGKFQTNIGFFDRLRLFRRVQQSTQPKDIPTLQSPEELAQYVHDWRLRSANPECSVAIINTTSVKGVGAAITSILEKTGVPVVRLSDSSEELPQTRIEVTQPSPFCDEVISQFAPLFPFVTTRQVNDKTRSTHRTNIVILIGQDFAKEWASKQP